MGVANNHQNKRQNNNLKPVASQPPSDLLNRSELRTLLERHVSKRMPFALILLDIDRFKLINYDFGDAGGDLVLDQVADAIHLQLGPEDQMGRWNGHQFLCVLPRSGANAALAFAETIRHGVEKLSIPIGTRSVHLSASLSVASFPDDGDALHRLTGALESALYQAKETGRNRVVAANALHHEVVEVANELDHALHEGRVVPAYQPIVELSSGHIVAAEALARLVTNEGKLLSAEAFIEVAHKLHLTHKIDQAIIGQTCSKLAGTIPNNRITHFVNISGNLLRHPAVVHDILHSMHVHCEGCGDTMEQKPIVIEITERELLGDIGFARAMLQPFVDFGLRLALDDFGSGYSSFQYLADLPFSFLKIEGNLIRRVAEPKVRTIVQGIQKTAHDLGLLTVAEYVENERIADIVRDIGVDWAQGFHYYRPALASS